MARRNESPEKKRRRELIGEFLKENPLQWHESDTTPLRKLVTQWTISVC